MKIAFMHYHLKPGGVTTVMRLQLRVLEDACETMALSGEEPDGPSPFETIRVSGIAYDKAGEKPVDPSRTARAVMDAIHSRWPGGCDVLHVHNPTLAKNRRFMKILEILKQQGVKLFLQIHDFAEDGRPDVYFQDEYIADCHYGVVNSRDHDILMKAGLSPGGLHLIPNAIGPRDQQEGQSSAPGGDFILYPIRAIRRKNIGEALLISLFLKKKETLAITLPPNSPSDMKSFTDWRRFSEQLGLNVLFNAGLKHPFPHLVRRARFMLTTSIAEGFGFSFLEPWAAGKPLQGRDLPEITRDFKANGVRLDHLHPGLTFPLSWIDMNQFHDRWLQGMDRARRAFGFSPGRSRIQAAFDRLRSEEVMDFSLLDESFQKKIIRRAAAEKPRAKKLARLNPFLADPGGSVCPEETIETNQRIVMEKYHPDVTKKRLLEIYKKVISEPVRHSIDKQYLLARFLDPAAFSLLKWGAYAG
ncbi:MAG: glycosyltransferase family 4 protein [Desulfobacterales bacterium]|nr:glycosyltransferase family 4 protein [Desulfobacterales bacterium]